MSAAKQGRTWTLRNRRGAHGPPLTAAEHHIHSAADIPALVAAIVAQALEDLDAGVGEETANTRYQRAAAYLWFFHGTPTGFERFAARWGIQARGRLPAHPLLDDAAALAARRMDVARLGLPPGLLDGRIVSLMIPVLRCNYEFGHRPYRVPPTDRPPNRGTETR